jgi:hypothetical protein
MKNCLQKCIMLILLCFGLTSWISAQNVIPVAAGDNAIGDALMDAVAGDIIELTTSGGVYTDSADIEIKFDLTFRAAEGLEKKPVIDGGTHDVFYVISGGLTLEGIKFKNGANVVIVEAIDPVTSSDFSVKISNCDFYTWGQAEGRAVYTSDGTLTPLDSILVKNSMFIDGLQQAFYLKQTRNSSNIFPGGYRYCKIENCLFSGISDYWAGGDGHATYIEPGNRNVGDQGWPTVIIDHVTVDNCWSGLSTYTTPGALVQNSIVTNLTVPDNKCYDIQSGRWTTDPLPPPSVLKNSIYSGGELNLQGSSTVLSLTENVDSITPVFVDAAHGNYELAEGSPGENAGTDGLDIGYLGPYPQFVQLPKIISPGFEEDTAFNEGAWGSDWGNSAINTDLKYVHSGSKSMKVGPADGGRAQYPVVDGIGLPISLLAWGTADGELNEPAWIGFVAVDEFGMETEAEGNTHGGPEMIPVDTWTRLCATMTIPEGTVELRVYLWYSGDLVNNVASVYVDDFQFVWGDSCTITNIKPIKYNSFVNVFPNPTDGPVQISIGRDLTGISSIELFDVTGKVVSRLNNLNGRNNVEMDLSSFDSGVYFGKVNAQNSTYSFKIIKK